MSVLFAAVLIGVVAGLRALLAPAIVSWAAAAGMLRLQATPLALLGWRYTPWIVSLLALGELVTDQLPSTPSRKVPMQFGARLLTGAACGAAFGVHAGLLLPGLLAGVVGAVLGTYGGAAARAALAGRLGSDRPAAVLEDLVALALGVIALALVP